MAIDKKYLCQPIRNLINELTYKDFMVIEQNVSDYHFPEVCIKMQGEGLDELGDFQIDKIFKDDSANFSCTCHW